MLSVIDVLSMLLKHLTKCIIPPIGLVMLTLAQAIEINEVYILLQNPDQWFAMCKISLWQSPYDPGLLICIIECATFFQVSLSSVGMVCFKAFTTGYCILVA